MINKRKLAVPKTTAFICTLPKATQDIIREDMRQHASEHGYQLEWDREAADYAGMSRRFCDIDEMYNDTVLEFCKEGEDIEAYENSIQREIVLKLKEGDLTRLCEKAGRVGLKVSELLENFISDLICGTRTNGSDERMYANQWFQRCWFSMEIYQSFLSYLIEWDSVDRVVEIWENLEDYNKQDKLDEDEIFEQQELQEEWDDVYKEYLEYNGENARPIEEEMKDVLDWKEERDRLMKINSPERVRR